MTNIKNKTSFVWVGLANDACTDVFIGDFQGKLQNTFIGSQNGASIPSSDPLQANLDVTYQNLDCGVGSLVFSFEVPYEIGDITESDYKEDKGLIVVNYPMQFVFSGSSGQGVYKITSQFKNDKPVYKNGEWYLWFDGSNWILSTPSPDKSGENYVQPNEPWSPPTPTPANQIPDVPFPSVKSPTNDKTPTWTWNAVSGATKYEVLVNQITDPNTSTIIGEIKTVFTNSYTETEPLADLSRNESHYYYFRSVNDIGSSMWVAKHVKIDTVPGALPSAFVFPGAITGWGAEFTAEKRPNITFKISGCHIAQISIDGAQYEQISVPYTGWNHIYSFSYTPSVDLDDGTRTYFTRSVDLAGNRSQYQAPSIIIDTTPPDVPVVSGTTPTTTTPVWTFNIPSSSPGRTSAGIQIKLNGNIVGSQFSPATYTGTELEDGTHKLAVRSYDTAGNYSDWSNEYTIVYDSTAPDIPQVTSESSITGNLRPTWTWEAVEDAVSYEVTLGGTRIGEQTETTYTPATDLDIPTGGTQTVTLSVRSKDSLGNFSQPGTFQIKIDKTSPVVFSITTDKTIESHNQATHIKRPTFSWNNTDSDLSHFILTLNGTVISDNYTQKTFQPTEDLPVGYNSLRINPVDLYGNKDWQPTRQVYGLRIFEPIEFRWHMINGKHTLQSRKFEKPTASSFPERDTVNKWSTVYITTLDANHQLKPIHRLGSTTPSLGVLSEYVTYNVPLPEFDDIVFKIYENGPYRSSTTHAEGLYFHHIQFLRANNPNIVAYKRGEDKTYAIGTLPGVSSTEQPFLVLSEMDTEDYENSDAGNLTTHLYSIIKQS